MKLLKWMLILILVPALSFATWQVANTKHHQKYKNQYIASLRGKTDYPKAYSDRYVFQVAKNGLKQTVLQNAKKYGWSAQWKVKKYPVLNTNAVAGPTFCVALNRLLAHYPSIKSQCNLSTKKVSIY
jgi:hypothetical protein